MIPKKIHYCWFGGNPLPELAQKCIASWKKYCPDYEIIEWNESNFDFASCDYAREAYEAKKWAFVTDYVRLKVLYDYGGIYMDTDVEVLKPLDSILHYEAVLGFESMDYISTALIASQKGMPIICELRDDYDVIHFIKEDGSLDLTTNVTRITNALLKSGLQRNDSKQIVEGIMLLPKDYFCPKNFETGIVDITDNTIAIHHFDGSWLSEEDKYINSLYRKYSQKFSNKTAHRLSLIVGYKKYRGLLKMLIEIIKLKLGNK